MKVISTPEAPEAIGPYAQAIEANGFIFCSGQLAINPASGEIEVVGAAEQMMRVLLNLRAVLEAAGSGLDRVVKTTLFLTDIGDFPAVNKVYGEMFGDHLPARSTVQVARLPRCARVELEAIALKHKASN
jgi:2-iminobutanoate/2-iminopropanoate deaminase